MKVLELFSGTESFSKVARKRGHETFTVDIDDRFEPDLCKDILDLKIEDIPQEFQEPHVMWNSPPCFAMSVASISNHWKDVGGRRKYDSERCKLGIQLLNRTLSLINLINPKYWIIENPRAMMRKLPIMEHITRTTVWYCKYQPHLEPENRTPKPTDLWNNFGFDGKSCKNGNRECHGYNPRGSSNGTQGRKNSKERAVVPERLCKDILDFIEEMEK